MRSRCRILLLACAALGALLPAAATAQAERSSTVTYMNPVDSMPLTASLWLPSGAGPFPGVVLTSLAGVDEIIERLNERGWAVLLPERRGIATIEQLLRASFADLEMDVEAALAYLRARPEVDAAVVGLISQGGETMAAALAADAAPAPAFVILLATTGLPGDETFRIEQHRIALDRKFEPDALAALDRYVLELTELVVKEPSPGLRAFQVRALLGESDISLPRNAAFPPNPEDQVRFFASLWWRELFLFRPDDALARVGAPIFVLMGTDDPLVPYELQIPAIERALDRAPSDDASVCLVTGRLQHSFTAESLDLIVGWLDARLGRTGFAARPSPPPEACVDLPLGLD